MAACESARILLAAVQGPFAQEVYRLLQKGGYTCDCVYNVEEATEALEAELYDLLITDIDLPGNRELELISIGQRDGYSAPVIVITGSPSVSSAVQSLHLAVVVQYLIKPVDPGELVRCIGPAVATGRLWRVAFEAYGKMTAGADDPAGWGSLLAQRHQGSVEAEFSWALDDYLEQTCRHVRRFAEELTEILAAVRRSHAGLSMEVCGLPHCPRATVYEDGLREMLIMLRKTGGDALPEDLSALRERLEVILRRSGSV